MYTYKKERKTKMASSIKIHNDQDSERLLKYWKKINNETFQILYNMVYINLYLITSFHPQRAFS